MTTTAEEMFRSVLEKVFSRNGLTDDDSPETVESWDSIGHIIFMSELEVRCGIKIPSDVVPRLLSIRSVKEYLRSRGLEL